jgi:microcompartment protein CcmL/EutN
MLDYNQRELLEEIEYSGMDVASYIDELIGSRTIKNLRENLLTLITEAKHLVEKAEELYKLVGVTEEKEDVGPCL